MSAARARGSRLLAVASAAALCLVAASPAAAKPTPPSWAGIGTSVGDVFGDGSGVSFSTSVSSVTWTAPKRVHAGGLDYDEVTGAVAGTGWGGEWEDLGDPGADPEDGLVHYAYHVPFVLRWPSSWDGTLVYYSHGRSSLGFLAFADDVLGASNEGRRLEHEGDFVSDAVLTPPAGHAYFAANVNGLDSDGSFSILGLEPPFAGEPLKATTDVPLARDLGQVAKRLLAYLAGRPVERVVGTGHSAGALVAQYMDGGLTDSPFTGLLLQTGGDYAKPYVPSSGTLVQAFVPLAGAEWRVHPDFPMAAPMLMIGGLSETSAVASVRYARALLNAGVDLPSMFRTYQVRDLPHNWAEIVESTPNLDAFIAALTGVPIHADGDRMQPVVAAVIEAAVERVRHGTPPPASAIDGTPVDTDGNGVVDAVAFPQASGAPTLLAPSVYDPVLDVFDGFQFEVSVAAGFPGTVTRYRQVLAVLPHEPALSLPKVACRTAGFRISDMYSDSTAIPLPPSFSTPGHGALTSCEAHAVHDLVQSGLYRPIH